MKSSHRRFTSRIALVLVTLSLGACASLQATRGTQLPVDMPLTAQANDPRVLSWRAGLQPLPRRYVLAPVTWDAADTRAVAPKDRAMLESALAKAIQASLAPIERSDAAGPGVVVVQAAITGVEPSNPAANVALSLLVGPADTGGASVSIRLNDGASGEPLAALVAAYNGGMFSTRGFRRWGHAEQAFEKAAAQLPALFATIPADAKAKDDDR